MARTSPYYKRNLPHICSFFVKGGCVRGDECPYRHELPTEGELANQNIKDRYYGKDDPVAKKLLRRHEDFTSKITPPADKDIKTLYIGNVDSRITEQNLKDHFYHFGEITSIKMVPASNCAFVTFLLREAAESAAQKLYNNLIINGVFLKIQWGKPQQRDSDHPLPDPSSLYGQPSAPYYPSMNPHRLGSTPETYVPSVPPPPPGQYPSSGYPSSNTQPPPPPLPKNQTHLTKESNNTTSKEGSDISKEQTNKSRGSDSLDDTKESQTKDTTGTTTPQKSKRSPPSEEAGDDRTEPPTKKRKTDTAE
eukprot:TRINITY_DN9791_c0_g1_i1.p1 TRINITY_DN9791_c0_g1~~TRINITY_DN9791_c0_g1_i1.p1  ORF type:complete len:327 (+),score=61.69 TRINITY_DN9791_c0_g1_i1:63-983(+)